MARIVINGAGTLGIIKDKLPHVLPPEAWTNGHNVRFQDGEVVKALGYEPVFGTPSVAPYWGMFIRRASDGDIFWLYSNKAKVYNWDGAVHTDITRAVGGDYAASDNQLWNGGVLGNIPIINNGVDVPQMWNTPAAATALQDLTNWPSTLRAAVVKPFGVFLLALDCTKSGTRYPHLLKWSHPASPGAVPSSWDETDATKDAGEREITAEGSTATGFLVDAVGLRDLTVLYKEGSVHGMQYIGGTLVFRTYTMFHQFGALATDCAKQFQRHRRGPAEHFVFTGDDMIVHDGQTAESIAESRVKSFLINNLDNTNYRRSYVVTNKAFHEIWTCITLKGDTWPTYAIVWNYYDNVFSFRDLGGGFTWIAPGVIVPESGIGETWDSDTAPWDSDTTPWDPQGAFSISPSLLLHDGLNTKLYNADVGNTIYSGGSQVPFTANIERTGLAVVGRDQYNAPIVDLTRRKYINRVYPRATGGKFNVYVGAQETVDDTIRWSPAMPFTPGVDEFVSVEDPSLVAGKLLAVRFESVNEVFWNMSGYDIDVELLGGYHA